MDITYIYSICNDIEFNGNKNDILISPVTGFMTEILENQNELNIIYSNITLLYMLSYNKYNKEISNRTESLNFLLQFAKEVINTIKTEYVLMTFGSYIDVKFAMALLKKGKKIIAGGAMTKIYDLDSLRSIMKYNGGTNLDNLVIVRPHINKTINIYKIIKEWKDIDIDVKFDVHKLNSSSKDFFLDYKWILDKHNMTTDSLILILNGICGWGKCTFCQPAPSSIPKEFSNINTIEQASEEILIKLKKYNAKKIISWDPEFSFTETTEYFLKFIRKHGYTIQIYTGDRLLKNDKYFNKVFYEYGDVIHNLLIGIETLDNFALKLLGRNTTVEDTFYVANKISKLNKKMNILNLFMGNLAYKNKQDIINNYRNMKLLSKIYDNDFNYSIKNYQAYPLVKYTQNNPFLKLKNHPLSFKNEYDRFDENGDKIIGTDKEISNHEFNVI